MLFVLCSLSSCLLEDTLYLTLYSNATFNVFDITLLVGHGRGRDVLAANKGGQCTCGGMYSKTSEYRVSSHDCESNYAKATQLQH